jgi:hypothetical protein
MVKTKANWDYRINRQELMRSLGEVGKLSNRDYERFDVEVRGGTHWNQEEKRYEVIGRFNVMVVAHDKTRGTRHHRVLIQCPRCKHYVPSGRLHQHMGRRDHQVA